MIIIKIFYCINNIVYITGNQLSEQERVKLFLSSKIAFGFHHEDNVINNVQEFKTQTIGNNDFKMVFIGTSGSCKMEVFLNGGVDPSFTKFFTW